MVDIQIGIIIFRWNMSTSLNITVPKLEAARGQLKTAIMLWFSDEDPISVHTLVCAAHQIIHDINSTNNGRDLLFDSLVVKDEYRKEWVKIVKKEMNFFKHADNDPGGIINFNPMITEIFLLFSIVGLEVLGEKLNKHESAFSFWLYIHRPNLLTTKGKEFIKNNIPIEHLDNAKLISKRDFLNGFIGISSALRSHIGVPS